MLCKKIENSMYNFFPVTIHPRPTNIQAKNFSNTDGLGVKINPASVKAMIQSLIYSEYVP
jgi:hypothetical protein